MDLSIEIGFIQNNRKIKINMHAVFTHFRIFLGTFFIWIYLGIFYDLENLKRLHINFLFDGVIQKDSKTLP